MYDEGDRVILIHKLCIYTQVKISKYISDVDSICICMYMYINGKQDSLPVIEFAPLPPVSRTIRVEDTFPAFAPTGSHFISFFFLIFIFFSFFFFFVHPFRSTVVELLFLTLFKARLYLHDAR